MKSRLLFGVFFLFWVVMNTLLWRAEFGQSGAGGSPVDEAVVLERILTAPDVSTLEVLHHGESLGYLHWFPDSGSDQATTHALGSDYVPEGMVRGATGYVVRLEAQLNAPELETRLRFNLELRLDANRAWESLTFNGGTRPGQLNVEARAAKRELVWSLGEPLAGQEHRLSFDDLRDPRTLLEALGGGPAVAKWQALLAPTLPSAGLGTPLRWEARLDWMPVGSTRVRVYRLTARILDGVEVLLFANRVGEVLRVDLPGGLRLLNEGLRSY